jgi:hypothetical protein
MQPRKRPAVYAGADRRVSATESAVRLAEPDRRLAADNRSETQKLLGDPISAQSVLGQRLHRANLYKIIDDLIDTLRR